MTNLNKSYQYIKHFRKLQIMCIRNSILLFFLCQTVIIFGQNKLILEKMSAEINSAMYDEISPIVSYNGQTIYFTRVGHPDFDKTLEVEGKNLFLSLSPKQYDNYLAKIYSSISGQTVRNATSSAYNQDVWIASLENNEFQSLTHPGPPLNNALPNSICALTPEDDSFILINQFLPGGGMKEGFSKIKKQGDNWLFPKPVQIENYYTNGRNVNVTMSPDGEVLIMSLEREKGNGRNDLYVSFKNGVGGWTEPMNLGKKINSKFSEDTPTISEDKKTIYFSSNRTNAMGGRDIYRSRRNSENWADWTIPRRFIAPINSNRDDSQPFFNDRTGYLYFTSNREGSSDIYRVKVATPKKEEVIVKGKIINANTKQAITAKLFYGPTDLEHYLRFFNSKDGTFEFRMPQGETYKITAELRDFIATQEVLTVNKGKYQPTQHIVIEMTPISENTEIKLDPIYFQQTESIILESSYPTLDYLTTLLEENQKIHIKIEGHTENIGEADDLFALSEARAFAIKRYLMDKGIDSARLATKGFGGSRPAKQTINTVAQEKNRRVEIRITKVD